MNDQIRKAVEAIKSFWLNLSRKARRLILIGIVLLVIVSLALSIILNSKQYVVIYEQLTQAETSEILAQLYEMGISAKIDEKGSIMVPKEEETSIRMALATKGFPKSGLSYYLIEQGNGMLSTDYEREQYVNIQLQERIAASIKTLDGVKDAIVTITNPGKNVFYLQEKEEPTASVIIHMETGHSLSDSQVLGIQNLVVKSVSGLKSENVAISDSSGNDLVGNNDSEEISKISITREIENDIRKKIISVLQGPYDSSQFRISVTATVDTDHLIKEETLYTPSPDGDNTGVISEEERNTESSSSTQISGGVPGTSSNSEIPVYPVEDSTGESTSQYSSVSTKYQVSQIISQFQKMGAKIESVSIGIAIDKLVFEPGEKESLTRLVAHAAGVDESNIAVENFVFHNYNEAPAPPETDEMPMNSLMLYAAAGAALLLLATLLIILLRRRRTVVTPEAELAVAEDPLDELFGKAEEDLVLQQTKDKKRKEIQKFAQENPEIAAQMIRIWLRSEDKKDR